ncbi:MAG: disulfide bond formation protein B [Rhodospirillaceae bacterium]
MLLTLWGRATGGWRAPALLAAIGIAALNAAFFLQYVVGVQPCVLCVYQRIPYGVAAALGLTALVFGRHRRLRAALLALIALAMLIGCGTAVFHLGIETHWWAGSAGCGVPPPAASVEALRAQLLSGPIVRCDEVSWSLFGISLAGYNIPLTLALALFALAASRKAAAAQPGSSSVSQ